jgi:hypothetical protein
MPHCISCASVAQVASSKRRHIGVVITCTKHANTHCNMHDFGTPECTASTACLALQDIYVRDIWTIRIKPIFIRQKLCLLREPTESAHTEAVGETNLQTEPVGRKCVRHGSTQTPAAKPHSRRVITSRRTGTSKDRLKPLVTVELTSSV